MTSVRNIANTAVAINQTLFAMSEKNVVSSTAVVMYLAMSISHFPSSCFIGWWGLVPFLLQSYGKRMEYAKKVLTLIAK